MVSHNCAYRYAHRSRITYWHCLGGGAPDTLNAEQIKVGEFSFGVGAIAFFIGFIFEDFLNWLKRTLVTTLENNGTGKIVMK